MNSDKNRPLKIGLKYCGGCRAGYDRTSLVQMLRERLSGRIEFVNFENAEADMFLIVTGCKRACAGIDDQRGRVIRVISGPEDAGRWREEIISG